MKRWLYYAKAQAGANWLGIAAAGAVVLLLLFGGAFQASREGRRLQDVYVVLQVFLPLTLGLLLAGLPAQEQAERTAEIYLTYRQAAWLRLLEQILLSCAAWATLTGLAGLLIDRWYATLTLAHMVQVSVPPALALGGAALAGGTLSRSSVGGVLAAAVWWAIDLLAPGLNRLAYLFNHFQPLSGSDPTLLEHRLLMAGAVGLAVALFLAGRRARWVSGV